MTKSTINREPITHDLKIYPEFFSAVCTGVKRAELRKNDRDYRVGDTLHLTETPRGSCHQTGEFINVKITHIADVGEWMPGYVLLSVELQERRKSALDSEPVIIVGDDGGDALSYRRLIQSFEPGTKLYRHAQPAPVVPEEKPIPNTLSMYAVDAVAAIAEVKGWNACRAAMLHAGNPPAQSDCCPAQNHVSPEQSGDTPAQRHGWIPLSEQMPEREVDVQVYCPDKKEQMVAYLESNELEGYFRFATWRTGDGIYCQPTHWMQLPAGPREVKGE
ncbi:DUF3850 domain-containing protein [Klebsiella oxytoca]